MGVTWELCVGTEPSYEVSTVNHISNALRVREKNAAWCREKAQPCYRDY